MTVLPFDRAVGLAFLVLVAITAGGWPTQAMEVPVPKVTIYPGEMISEQSVVLRDFRTALPRAQVVDRVEQVVGKVARRTLLPGQPISLVSVKEPDVVVQGKAYPVIFQVGGLTITSLAVPLQNGGAGDYVMLRNPDSGQIIKGVVLPNGTISVAQ